MYSDEYGSNSYFTVTLIDADGSITNTAGDTYIQQTGSNTFISPNGEVETSEYVENYSADQTTGAMGNFLGGSTTNNGQTLILDENREITGQSKTVDAGAIALTAAELEGVPAALQSTQDDDGQGNGYTYADVEDFGYGSETMYYDSTGTILGYANVNSYSGDYGSGSNVSYRDANDNDLGSSYEDYDASGTLMSKGSTIVSFGNDTAGDVFDSAVKYRKVVNTMEDLDGSTQTSTYYYNNDDTDDTPPTTMPEPADMTVADTIYGQMMAGFEEMGATTRELGPNGYVKGEKADLTNLQVADLSNLPTAFVDAAIGTGTQTPIEIDVTRDSTSGTLFFDGAAIPDGFTINEGDIYIFDTSDPSMAGYSIGFAESKDNSNNDAIGASDGVTISGVPGDGANAKTTVQLASGYGGDQGNNVRELHIFLAEEQTTSPTITWSGNAYNPVNGVQVSDNTPSTNAYDVNLSGTIVLTPGENYTLTFDAKGADGRTLLAGIGESGGAYRNDVETITISDAWGNLHASPDCNRFRWREL